MGEYLKLKNQADSFKIGTCENLYYLTYPQAVSLAGQIDNSGDVQSDQLFAFDCYRFRFPFPDEAGINPGDFENSRRGLMIYFPITAAEINHGTIFVRTDSGKIGSPEAPALGMKFPCPIKREPGQELFFWDHRQPQNTFAEIIQQKPVICEGRKELQTVVRCPYCGDMVRLSYIEVLAIVAFYSSLSDVPEIITEALEIALAGYTYFEPLPEPVPVEAAQ